MSSNQVRAYKDGLLKLERRGERYVPLNITNNTTELVNNVTKTLPSEVSKDVQQTDQNITRNDVCIQNQPNETYCYLFGKYSASMSLTSTMVVKTGTTIFWIKMLDLLSILQVWHLQVPWLYKLEQQYLGSKC